LGLWSARTDSQTSRGDTSYIGVYTAPFGGFAGDIRSAMTYGLLMREGIQVKDAHPASRDFQHMSLREISAILIRGGGE